MRLRIVHQLSLLLVGGVLLALLAMAAFVTWNLSSGFSDYLRERDRQLLARFATLVTQRAETDPTLAALQSRQGMRGLMDEFLRGEGVAPPAQRDDDGPPEDRRPPPGQRPAPAVGAPDPLAGDGEGPPRPLAGRRGPALAEALRDRLHIVDTQHRHLAGRPVPRERPAQELPVLVNGAVVAYVRLALVPDMQDVDRHFLRRQYQGLAAAGALTLLASLGLALLVAGRFSRPLQRLQAASRRIAQGEFDVHLPPEGAQEIAQLMGDVNRMAAALMKLEAARRAWIAQISHELRTPLAVLRGELEAMEDGVRQPTPSMLANLREEVLQLVRLVNDLHTLSVADLGQLRCEFADHEAGAIVAHAAQRFQPRLEKAGLRLEVLPHAQPVRVHWDLGRIEQLLANLLENSLRYTHTPGVVRLRWQPERGPAGPAVEIVVEDSPPGVQPAELAQLFEPLYRADTARQRRPRASGHADADGEGGGSGLGLAIAKAIAQAHGGSMVAQASPLGGLAVRVLLPLDPDPARATAPSIPTPPGSPPP